MGLRIALAGLGLLHLLTGLWMLAAPEGWYQAVPGVMATGPMNMHFITDIGLAFAASGAGLLMALRPGIAAAALALAGSVWPMLHGLFHLVLWLMQGVPPNPRRLVSEGIGVMLVSFVGFALAVLRARKQGVF
jgi:hypothetical protein